MYSTKMVRWRRQWHPTPVLLPGKSHGRRSVVGYSPWGCKESDTTERLHFLVQPLLTTLWEASVFWASYIQLVFLDWIFPTLFFFLNKTNKVCICCFLYLQCNLLTLQFYFSLFKIHSSKLTSSVKNPLSLHSTFCIAF